MQLWFHDETGRTCWSNTRPSHRYHEVETMYEDELPESITDEEYSAWFDMSTVVDGVRIGPVLCLWNTRRGTKVTPTK